MVANQGIYDNIESLTGKEPSEYYETNDKDISWSTVDAMLSQDIISNSEGKHYDLKYTIYGGKSVARIEYAIFDNCIGYIRWVRVSDDYKGNGLGYSLWDVAVGDMLDKNVNKIYVKAVAEGTRKIAESTGFNLDSNLSSPWMVKTFG